ncbi:MAG TPA: sigma-54-dependent Fis family transcriptional regulator [Pseudomonas xinjiangensis]|uniref:Sigma-54-dependent Fis family transcriptional regulator n=2 Tax=root TaxID=1 RepID=A0A7V1FS19_9GAMM|nr:sigma-54-dependent Fis family transcriptional regulator [Halopseudomonas xinjiangensis]HEC48580.1 sigma-54-dependent Fis family transcriptional regulator [Halopseudomonas xinjiangensis]
MKAPENRLARRALIEASWRRCRAFGLDHASEPAGGSVQEVDVPLLRNRHHSLIDITGQEVLPYYESILSNSKSVILLADCEGRVLSDWGDQRLLDGCNKALFRHGATWQERANGTNAIGTTIATGQAVQVLRDEHFLKGNRFMIGSAAPILDTDRTLLGVLNVSSDTYLPQAHTLGMVKLMSQSIENRLIIQHYRHQHFLLTFNTNLDNIDSQWSGLLVFDEQGTVVAANRRAELMAGANPTGSSIEQLFHSALPGLKNQPEQLPVVLRLNKRQTVYGVIKKPQPVPGSEAPPKPYRPVAAAPANAITLARIGFGDARISRCIQQAERIIEKDIPILIQGETGVGKEVFVKALHSSSSRSQSPLVAINCAAIPAELVESELFGYERGAFTGASNKGASGLIRKAHGGTLFLDEIGEMPLSAQARLLRVLQERTVTPLGSTEAYPVDIRLITATNRSLRQQVAEGAFRRDLFYRINGLNLELPPLRHRTDKTELFRQLHAFYSEAPGKYALADSILRLFEQHPWPGNIRQLINVLQVGLAMAGDQPLERWHLPDDFFTDLEETSPHASQPPLPKDAIPICASPTEDVPSLFRKCQGNVSRVARELSVSRNTVYKRLKEHGLR